MMCAHIIHGSWLACSHNQYDNIVFIRTKRSEEGIFALD